MPAARARRSTRRSRGCRSSRRSSASRSTNAPRTRRAWRRSRASSATDERALSPGPRARPADAAARAGGGTEPRRRRARRGRPPRRPRTEEAMRVIKGLVLLGLAFKVMVLGLWCWDSVAHAERQTKPTDAVAETALVPSDLLARSRCFHDLLDAVRQRGQALDERE